MQEAVLPGTAPGRTVQLAMTKYFKKSADHAIVTVVF